MNVADEVEADPVKQERDSDQLSDFNQLKSIDLDDDKFNEQPEYDRLTRNSVLDDHAIKDTH